MLQVGSKVIRVDAWDAEIKSFEAVIDDFNIRGQRDQINHPGFLTKFKFCPDCGANLSTLQLCQLDWKS